MLLGHPTWRVAVVGVPDDDLAADRAAYVSPANVDADGLSTLLPNNFRRTPARGAYRDALPGNALGKGQEAAAVRRLSYGGIIVPLDRLRW